MLQSVLQHFLQISYTTTILLHCCTCLLCHDTAPASSTPVSPLQFHCCAFHPITLLHSHKHTTSRATFLCNTTPARYTAVIDRAPCNHTIQCNLYFLPSHSPPLDAAPPSPPPSIAPSIPYSPISLLSFCHSQSSANSYRSSCRPQASIASFRTSETSSSYPC